MSYAITAYNVTHGLPTKAFKDLSPSQRKVLLTLLSRVAERSYRRGFQQGVTLQKHRPQDIRPDLADWRYGNSADKSPWGDCNKTEPSLQRLWSENGELSDLGFDEEYGTYLQKYGREDEAA